MLCGLASISGALLGCHLFAFALRTFPLRCLLPLRAFHYRTADIRRSNLIAFLVVVIWITLIKLLLLLLVVVKRFLEVLDLILQSFRLVLDDFFEVVDTLDYFRALLIDCCEFSIDFLSHFFEDCVAADAADHLRRVFLEPIAALKEFCKRLVLELRANHPGDVECRLYVQNLVLQSLEFILGFLVLF